MNDKSKYRMYERCVSAVNTIIQIDERLTEISSLEQTSDEAFDRIKIEFERALRTLDHLTEPTREILEESLSQRRELKS